MEEQITVYAFPVFLLLMLVELGYGLFVGRNTYRLSDALSNLSQGLLSQLVASVSQLFQIGLYILTWRRVTLFPHAGLWGSGRAADWQIAARGSRPLPMSESKMPQTIRLATTRAPQRAQREGGIGFAFLHAAPRSILKATSVHILPPGGRHETTNSPLSLQPAASRDAVLPGAGGLPADTWTSLRLVDPDGGEVLN